jgi:hypothetical protein
VPSPIVTATPHIPIHFLIRPQFIGKLKQLVEEGVDRHFPLFAEGPESWGLQTYIHAIQHGWNVSAGPEVKHGCVNFGHVSTLHAFQSQPGDMIVGMRADYRRSLLADCHIVQNKLQVDDKSFWVPHWSQPGLIPRDPDRQGVLRVAYLGRAYYLGGDVDRWRSALKGIGIEFECRSADRWNDFRDVDLVIAIRSFDDYPYPRKPPSKLLNAWIAGVPAIVGHESAYSQIGEAGRDFVVANSFENAIEQITLLQSNPNLYQSIVKAGMIKAREYSRENTLAAWGEIINTQLTPIWDRVRSPSLARRLSWLFRNSLSGIRSAGVRIQRRLWGSRPLSR